MDPNQAFLVRRGMKTLGLRMEAAQANAIKVADFLDNHPKIAWVRYPGLKSHPQHELSKKMMHGPGAMISFGVKVHSAPTSTWDATSVQSSDAILLSSIFNI